jgi:transposase-like protein
MDTDAGDEAAVSGGVPARGGWAAAIGRSIPDVAEALGSRRRRCETGAGKEQANRGEREDTLTSAECEELRELRKRVRRPEYDRDILTRATALFAGETETR